MKWLIVAAATILVSCVYSIRYEFDDVQKTSATDLKNMSITVNYFGDKRREKSYLRHLLFKNTTINRIDCYNLEDGYRTITPSQEISKMIAMHTKIKNAFKSVFIGKNDSVDIIVSGNVSSFAVHCDVNSDAEATRAIGAMFGIIGNIAAAAATSGMTSRLDYKISYSNVRVTDRNGNTIREIDDFTTQGDTTIPAQTSCMAIYSMANSLLKKHNERFVDTLLNNIIVNKTSPKLPATDSTKDYRR